MIARNHLGYMVGQCHQRARLSDAEVRRMRKLREAGNSYGTLAVIFDCGVSTARDICTGRTRWSA